MRKPRKGIPNGVKMTNRYYKTAGDGKIIVPCGSFFTTDAFLIKIKDFNQEIVLNDTIRICEETMGEKVL